MVVPLRRRRRPCRKGKNKNKVKIYSDGEVHTAIKLEGGGGYFFFAVFLGVMLALKEQHNSNIKF